MVLNPVIFPYVRLPHLHAVPCLFFSFFSILLCVVSISHCLILLYRSNASRDVVLSLLYCSIN
jgi:hypothetical protein